MPQEYPKIHTVYKRDPETNNKRLIEGDFSLPEFEYLQNNVWEFTEKIDGMNTRVCYSQRQITFHGKTGNSQIPSLLINHLNNFFLPKLENFQRMFPDPAEIILFGEGYGTKIQKGGGNYRPDQGFVLFDVWIDGWWLQRKDVINVAKELELDMIPFIGEGTLLEMVEKARQGFNSSWGDFMAEGIVARPKIELKNRRGDRLITKIKYKDFEHIWPQRRITHAR